MKAITGGIAGAVLWEVCARVAVFAGLRPFDIVQTLGKLAFGEGSSVMYCWPSGLAMHCLVGSIWAIFYAYFFWSMFNVRPMLQGMLFSLLPAVLAGIVMVPQLDVMREAMGESGIFAYRMGWLGPLTIVVGHLIYGAVLGGIYIRPVGYKTGSVVKINV